uniref:Uncharacterized protein n=1 Tax=Anopheles arabiensis TaxID=7173 RepID=A0A182IFU2_ANOAR
RNLNCDSIELVLSFCSPGGPFPALYLDDGVCVCALGYLR